MRTLLIAKCVTREGIRVVLSFELRHFASNGQYLPPRVIVRSLRGFFRAHPEAHAWTAPWVGRRGLPPRLPPRMPPAAPEAPRGGNARCETYRPSLGAKGRTGG